MGGYMIGSETYIPAKGYFTKDTKNINWTYAFERPWLFYKTWGRLLYNSATNDEVFQNEFNLKYGESGKDLLKASQLAGKTPLTLASIYDFGWDFTLYSEGFLALSKETGRVDFIDINRLINQKTLDPVYLSISDFVDAGLSNKPKDAKDISPLQTALKLREDCTNALDIVRNKNSGTNQALKSEIGDIQIWANLGLYLAKKEEAGVALYTFRKTGDIEQQNLAIKYLVDVKKYWEEVVRFQSHFISICLWYTLANKRILLRLKKIS